MSDPDPHIADTDPQTGADAAAILRTTTAIRERAGDLLGRARGGQSRWFTVDDDALAAAATVVAEVTERRYPDLAIPYHSRWRHFEAGGVDRNTALRKQLSHLDTTDGAAALIDLAVVSVLLDAGAGPDWSYTEPDGSGRYARSEGLAVASLHAFSGGLFSGDPADPLRVDAAGLRALTVPALAEAFEVTADNPLVGLDGRVELLRRLGDALAEAPEVFGPEARPGGLFAALADGTAVAATDILGLLLRHLSPIWLADNTIDDVPLGDCWRHEAVGGPGRTAGWMPLHKLSQWLTYSLLEPFEWAGVPVTDLDALTALAEYRNGGLLLDTGVLQPIDPATLHPVDGAGRPQPVAVGAEVVVEWRALTVALLDELAPLVRERLGVDADRMPLACVLEGGTWAAGRELAGRTRGGLPPFDIVSNGTVF